MDDNIDNNNNIQQKCSFFYTSHIHRQLHIYIVGLYVCVNTEQYYYTFLLVGKREKERREEKNEEPSRKKGRQARSK